MEVKQIKITMKQILFAKIINGTTSALHEVFFIQKKTAQLYSMNLSITD